MPSITPGASLPLKGNGATVTVSTPLLNLTQTWSNVATTFTGLSLNVTDTNSAPASLLLDLQVGGVSQFWVRKDGAVNAANSYRIGGNAIVQNSQIALNGDTIIIRDALNVVALRNSTTAQTFNIYNTFTDASNYERLAIKFASNVATILGEHAGTGTTRNIRIQSENIVYLNANGNEWNIGSTGALTTAGSIIAGAAVNTLVLKQGANGCCGTFVANGVTAVTVNNTNVAVTDTISISLNTVGGSVGAQPVVKTVTAGAGFTVAATAADTSTYNYVIIKNAA